MKCSEIEVERKLKTLVNAILPELPVFGPLCGGDDLEGTVSSIVVSVKPRKLLYDSLRKADLGVAIALTIQSGSDVGVNFPEAYALLQEMQMGFAMDPSSLSCDAFRAYSYKLDGGEPDWDNVLNAWVVKFSSTVTGSIS